MKIRNGCSYRNNLRTPKTVLLAYEVPGTTPTVGREVHGNQEEGPGREGGDGEGG